MHLVLGNNRREIEPINDLDDEAREVA